MKYTTLDKANSFLWKSWEDDLITNLIEFAESMIDRYLQVDSLKSSDAGIIESYDYKWSWPYFLKQINPTSILEINWSSVADNNYLLKWRKLIFNFSPSYDTFNQVKIKYKYWFIAIPSDVELACLYLVWWIYNSRKWLGISSFEHWDLKIDFRDSQELTAFKSLLVPYKKNVIIS